jgi:hypothetical protein
MVTTLSVLSAVSGLFIVRKFVSHEALRLNHDVAGALLSIIGTLYSVVLGLIVVGALNTFQQARVTVAQEANCLHDIFHLVAGLPAPIEKHIREDCLEYASVLINDEWKAMEVGTYSDKAHLLVNDMWNTLVRYQPQTQKESDLHASLLAEMNALDDNRQVRLNQAAPVYDFIIWTVLIGGGAVLVIFTYFFAVKRLLVQVVMTTMVALILSLNLMIVAMFGYPYSGDVHVPPEPFESVLNKIRLEINTDKQKTFDPAIKSIPDPTP